MATSIDFPSSPSVGQEYTYGSVTYKWDGFKWVVLGTTTASQVTFENLDANGDVGVTADTVAEGNDSRFTDTRTPTDDTVTTTKLAIRYKSIVTVAALDIDWASGQIHTKTLTTNSTLTFSNIHIGVKDVEITGNYTLGFPAYVKILNGEYDGTVANFIQFVCTKDTATESVWCTISQEAT